MTRPGWEMGLRWAFWLVACGDAAVLLVLTAQAIVEPHGQFGGLLVVVLLAMLLALGVVMGVVALLRRPVAYWIGLALVLWPPLQWGASLLMG